MAIAPVLTPAGYVPRIALSFGSDGAAAVAVDELNPLPLASGAPGVTAASIAAGTSLGAALDLGAQRLHHVVVPANWSPAAISFQCSADGQEYFDLHDMDGEVVLSATLAAANRAVAVDPAIFFGLRFLKLRSGTAGAPVAQGAARMLALGTVAR